MTTIKKFIFFVLAIFTLLLCCSCGCDSADIDKNVDCTAVQTKQASSFENGNGNTSSEISSETSSYTKSKTENTNQTSAQDVLGVFDSDQVEDE